MYEPDREEVPLRLLEEEHCNTKENIRTLRESLECHRSLVALEHVLARPTL